MNVKWCNADLPDQYEIIDQLYFPASSMHNICSDTDAVNGLYVRINPDLEPLSGSLLSAVQRYHLDVSDEDGYDLRNAVRYSNRNGSDLIMLKLQKRRYKWYLTTSYPTLTLPGAAAAGIERSRPGAPNSFTTTPHFMVYESSNEKLKVVGDLPQLARDLQEAIQYTEYAKGSFPFYPQRYRIYLQYFGFGSVAESDRNLPGVYRRINYEIPRAVMDFLERRWRYDTLLSANIMKYENDKNVILFVYNHPFHREYDLSFYDVPAGTIGAISSETSDFFVHVFDDGTQMMIYNDEIEIERPQSDVHIPVIAIFIMMVLSVCFVLTFLTMIIKTWCMEDYNTDYMKDTL